MKKSATANTRAGIAVTHGSGDVWIDLGFSPAEARNLEMRSQIMTALEDFVTQRKLTQVEAAKLFRVTQPRISDLMRGRISRFSLDTLVKMLVDAGLKVDLRIRKPSRRAA